MHFSDLTACIPQECSLPLYGGWLVDWLTSCLTDMTWYKQFYDLIISYTLLTSTSGRWKTKTEPSFLLISVSMYIFLRTFVCQCCVEALKRKECLVIQRIFVLKLFVIIFLTIFFQLQSSSFVKCLRRSNPCLISARIRKVKLLPIPAKKRQTKKLKASTSFCEKTMHR